MIKKMEEESDFNLELEESFTDIEDSEDGVEISTEPENSRNTGAEVSKEGEIVFKSFEEFGKSTQILTEVEKEREERILAMRKSFMEHVKNSEKQQYESLCSLSFIVKSCELFSEIYVLYMKSY